MYRGYLSRKKEVQVRAAQQQPSMHAALPSQSSSSSASSFSSYTPSSVLSAASSSNSSCSDNYSSDHYTSGRAPSTSPKNRFFPISKLSVPRSTTPTHMGQATSTDTAPQFPVSQPFTSSTSLTSPSSNRLKRLWGGRRKKSQDATAAFANTGDSLHIDEQGRVYDISATSSVLSTPASSVDDLQSQIPSKSQTQASKSPKFGASAPLPPPKPSQLLTGKKSNEGNEDLSPSSTASGVGGSNIHLLRPPFSPSQKDKAENESKQDWRKSDSTVTSFVTIRPGAHTGGRSPRPVSLAESSHSGHTIVPVNKRLSALLTDAEFAMLEEDDSDTEQDVVRMPLSGRPSPTSTLKARNRRSASLNLGPGHITKAAFDTSVYSPGVPPIMPALSRTFTDTPHTPRNTPAVGTSTIVTSGFISSAVTTPAQSSNPRSRNAGWTAPLADRTLPIPQHQRRPTPPTHTRQPTVSMSGGGFAPVALGFGRRAAEKVHRVWEGLSSGASIHSSSSSASVGDSSSRAVSRQSIYGLQSSLPGAWKQRRTPGGPSGAWSISSASSESDTFSSPAGPSLGPCLRGPRRNAVGTNVIGGVVFGRDLRSCVRDAAIDSIRVAIQQAEGQLEVGGIKPLEQRMLPAIVVRCYQHLMRWGLEEEGLFRINGRASHVAKLRSEFDTGSDYELVSSDPGDLDPHAVASIFKAYLRELPESLLTSALVPLFESAVAKDTTIQQPTSAPRSGLSLRKPPSLSTLAMPSFAGQRSVSSDVVKILASLIAQLPAENRDLLYTVIELINATAAASKETKMPLGNLLLLFCPSLGVSHTLLRVLCESKDIWTAPEADASSPTSPETPGVRTLSSSSNSSSPSLVNTDSESDLSDLPPARPRQGKRRGPVATILNAPGISFYRSSSSSGQDDAASYMSALDGSPSNSNESSTNLPALTTSTDSIATPSTMSEVSSLQQSAVIYPSSENKGDSGGCAPEDSTPVDLSIPAAPRRPAISAPIPFPSSDDNSPRTPISPRKSLALLSFPPLGKSDPGSPGASSTWSHRPKRPSLHLLFSKKSLSSLTSSSPAQSRRDSAITSADTIQAPPTVQLDVSPAPPILDTPISSSPIHLFDATGPENSSQHGSSSGDLLAAKESDWQGRERNDSSSGSSLFSTPQQTPIADYFRGRSKSLISLVPNTDPPPAADSPQQPFARSLPAASTSRTSLTPSIDVGIESTVEEDWAQSVIEEVQASKSRWRVSKLF
ncbi:RhoGAP-domain-containing protein [Trametopsis cervina]|nr:RhoGAP-domain-containing protein [Trametopsis cervina]